MKTKKERENRILARGEVSGHSHIITGECEIIRNGEDVTVKAGNNCAIKHLIEKPFVEEGREEWTGEHTDIPLRAGETYKNVQQVEFNPYEKVIRNVQD
jgi:hypothetical protein